MPTYEYECASGHRFERFQKMSDPPERVCPECGADARRVLSGGAGFLFKGGGFYITDYRSKEYQEKAASEKKSTEKKGGEPGAPKESGSATGSSSSGGEAPSS